MFKHFDSYIVRDEVWREAGMDGYSSGFLCTPCLQKRLGRDLTDDDFLMRTVRATNSGLHSKAKPEYIERVLHGRGY